jgi:GNAT acetyltransferase-like protein
MANFREVKSLELLPWQLIEAERQQNVFLSQAYVSTWVKYHLGMAKPLYILGGGDDTVCRSFQIVLSTETFLGRRLKIWRPIGWNTAWYPDYFLPQDVPELFFALLQERTEEWDAVFFPCFEENRLDRVLDLTSRLAWHIFVFDEAIFPYVTVANTWEKFYAARSKHLRQDVRRCLNKSSRFGYLSYNDGAEHYKEIIQKLVHFHHIRWSEVGQPSKYATQERHKNFLEELVLRFYKDEKLFLRYLTLDGTLIAVAFCALDNHKLYYMIPTYDIKYRELSPGKLLLYYIIQEAFSLGCDEIDLGPGDDNYKWLWATESRTRKYMLIHRGDLSVWLKYYALPYSKKHLKPLIMPLMKRIAG